MVFIRAFCKVAAGHTAILEAQAAQLEANSSPEDTHEWTENQLEVFRWLVEA